MASQVPVGASQNLVLEPAMAYPDSRRFPEGRPEVTHRNEVPMAKRSFWEKLGRGVGHGIHKAMELGSQVTDQVEGKLELEKAEGALSRQHEALGRAVADTLLGGDDAPPWAAEPAVKELLERIREGREVVEKLRAEREAEEREAKERAEMERRAAETSGDREESGPDDSTAASPGREPETDSGAGSEEPPTAPKEPRA